MPQQICPNTPISRVGLALRLPAERHNIVAFSLVAFSLPASSLPPPGMMSTMSVASTWGIWCPGCKQTLSKAHWRQCQWTANGGKGHHEGGDPWGSISYTKCKTCQPRAIWEMDPEGLEEVCPEEELKWLSALLAKAKPEHFLEFIAQWMELLDAYTRKSWSYLGAVKGKRAGDLTEFDPGSWVYAHVLGLLCPTLMRAVEWNEETKGDICEALLALHDDLLSPNTVLGGQPQRFKDLVMEFGFWLTQQLIASPK